MEKHKTDLKEAALEFLQAAPWEILDDCHLFGIKDKITGLGGCASVLGCAGEEFGLSVALGDKGFLFMEKLLKSEIDRDSFMFELDGFLLSFSPGEQITDDRPPESDIMLLDCGMAATAWRKEAMKYPRKLKQKEALFLERILRAVLSLLNEKKLTRKILETPEKVYPLFTLSGKSGNMKIHAGRVEFPPDKTREEKFSLSPKLSSAIRGKPAAGRYFMSLWTLPVTVKDKLIRTFVVYDPDKDQVVYFEAFESHEYMRAAGEDLFRIISGGAQALIPPKRPRKILTDSLELYNYVKDALSELKIKAVCMEEIPQLIKLKQGLTEFLCKEKEKL